MGIFVKIMIVDDHAVMRSGLKALFEGDARFMIAGEASTGREAYKTALQARPDVILMDISMPDLNGIEATRMIVSEVPQIRVIALTMHGHRRYVSGMLKAGASGYLMKSCTFDEIVCAILSVMDGKTYISPSIADTLVKDYINVSLGNMEPSPVSDLTSREREVLQLIAEGLSTHEISLRLFVSESTVNTHRRQIMEKLNIHSIAKLTKFSIQEGLTSIED